MTNSKIKKNEILVVCTTDSMIWNFLVPHIKYWENKGYIVTCAASRTGFYFDELVNKFRINMVEVPFDRHPFKKKNYIAYKQLKKAINENNYSEIVCQEPVGGVIARIAGHTSNARIIYTAHGFHFFRGAKTINWILYYPIERMMSYYTNDLITINEEDYIIAKKMHAKNVYKIHGIGVNLNKFNSSAASTFDINTIKQNDNQIIILTVAELIPRKNYETALKTVKLLKEMKFNFRYLICGNGILENNLKKICSDYNIEDVVIFLGFRKDVSEIYKKSDIFFFPSYQEGLSIALIEAMSSGCKIVCSKIRGNTDLITENVGGYLADPKDYEEFASKIIAISSGHNDFVDYNKRKVRDYSIEKSTKEFFDIISKDTNVEGKRKV